MQLLEAKHRRVWCPCLVVASSTGLRKLAYLWTDGALVRAFRFLLAKLFLVVVVVVVVELVVLLVVLPPPPLAAAELSAAAAPLTNFGTWRTSGSSSSSSSSSSSTSTEPADSVRSFVCTLLCKIPG